MMAPMTTPNVMKMAPKSSAPTMLTSSPSRTTPYANQPHNMRLAGSNPIDNTEETVVIPTDNARLALNNEHHQLLYDPPGLAVTTNKETPIGCVNPEEVNATTDRNPKNGIKTNCIVTPVPMANLLVN
mmetsp:Transcript_51768/g.124965  ORF Transcript_51768/g.124965 Transcript_51768/m.124965 type:complete len:128 (-) Transcript_51768:309-692(-)